MSSRRSTSKIHPAAPAALPPAAPAAHQQTFVAQLQIVFTAVWNLLRPVFTAVCNLLVHFWNFLLAPRSAFVHFFQTICVGLFIVSIHGIYSYFTTSSSIFETVPPIPFVKPNHYYVRNDTIVNTLTEIFNNPSPTSAIIVGPKGVGKTLLATSLCHDTKYCTYIQMNNQFNQSEQAFLSLFSSPRISSFVDLIKSAMIHPITKYIQWSFQTIDNFILQDLVTYAETHFNTHQKPPVLVIDNFNQLLLPDNLKLFYLIKALIAIESKLTIILVTSEGIMSTLSSSQYTRLREITNNSYELDDISKEAATEYVLKELFNEHNCLSSNITACKHFVAAEKLVSFVGGRFKTLQMLINSQLITENGITTWLRQQYGKYGEIIYFSKYGHIPSGFTSCERIRIWMNFFNMIKSGSLEVDSFCAVLLMKLNPCVAEIVESLVVENILGYRIGESLSSMSVAFSMNQYASFVSMVEYVYGEDIKKAHIECGKNPGTQEKLIEIKHETFNVYCDAQFRS